MKKILITGGYGILGSCLANKLDDMGHDVFILDRSKKERTTLNRFINKSIQKQKGNFNELKSLLNIIKNACEACQAIECSPEVILETKYRSGVSKLLDGQGSAQLLPIEISVTDNGSGIPENILDKVFMPFVTSKKEGQGLGLPLVAKIASAHGGIVEFKSEQGKTTFSLLLTDRETL